MHEQLKRQVDNNTEDLVNYPADFLHSLAGLWPSKLDKNVLWIVIKLSP